MPTLRPTASVVRFQYGREWADVLVHADGSLYLVNFHLGNQADADEARAFVDEIRHGPQGIMACYDDLGPWVDNLGRPLHHITDSTSEPVKPQQT